MEHNPIWLIPVIIGGTIFTLVVSYILTLSSHKLRNILLNVMFLYNVAVEAFVSTRGQFTLLNPFKLKLAGWAMSAASGVLIVTYGDVYFSTMNHMPMQGQKMLINRPNHAPEIAPHQNRLSKAVSKANVFLQTLKHCSCEDKLRIAASIMQFGFRFAELLSRLSCDVDVCTVLENNLSAIPVGLALICLAKRIWRKSDPPLDTISIMFLGDCQIIRDEVDIPPPSSDFWRGCEASSRMSVKARKTFDIWSTDFTASGGEKKHFTMMEMRGQISANLLWYIPQVDFVIVHFPIANRARYNQVRETWIDFVRDHVKRSRVILVGTDADDARRNNIMAVSEAEGYDLAYRINAVTYLELEGYTGVHISKLFLKVVELID